MKTHEVFGIQSDVIDASYIDRGALDAEFQTLIDRGQLHIAIRGASKCGKSWLRKRVLSNPIESPRVSRRLVGLSHSVVAV